MCCREMAKTVIMCCHYLSITTDHHVDLCSEHLRHAEGCKSYATAGAMD